MLYNACILCISSSSLQIEEVATRERELVELRNEYEIKVKLMESQVLLLTRFNWSYSYAFHVLI